MTDEDRESFAGSSPHTRGAPVPAQTGRKASGIIPAYAGSTERPRSREAIAWDHPRIRGEHSLPPTVFACVSGSSPHTRGAPIRTEHEHMIKGIIPAYAGSTFFKRFSIDAIWDHPRIRGEHSAGRYHVDHIEGSSPHTRGARTARNGWGL